MNRGFLYGDGFFESIRTVEGSIPLLPYHIQRIQDAVKILRLESEVELNEAFLEEIVKANEHPNARVRVNFFRDAEGTYLPTSNRLGFNVNQTPTDSPFFLPQRLDLASELQKAPISKGKAGLFPDPKPVHSLFTIKSLSSAYYVLAAIFKKDNDLDCLLIGDADKNILEELSCNLILKINDSLVIPPLESGMIRGASLRYIVANYGFQLEQRNISLDDVYQAEEIYLSQGTTGIRRFIIA